MASSSSSSRAPPSFARSRPFLLGLGLMTTMQTLLFVRTTAYDTTSIQGFSMAPTLSPDSRLGRHDKALLKKTRAAEELRRGRIVGFYSPANPDRLAVKRIVGLPGDRVQTRKPYPFRTVTVPDGCVWVEGDEGFHSVDSNTYGPVRFCYISPFIYITRDSTDIL
jgi:signal peptidase I